MKERHVIMRSVANHLPIQDIIVAHVAKWIPIDTFAVVRAT
jgi:hypothetical protein